MIIVNVGEIYSDYITCFSSGSATDICDSKSYEWR